MIYDVQFTNVMTFNIVARFQYYFIHSSHPTIFSIRDLLSMPLLYIEISTCCFIRITYVTHSMYGAKFIKPVIQASAKEVFINSTVGFTKSYDVTKGKIL